MYISVKRRAILHIDEIKSSETYAFSIDLRFRRSSITPCSNVTIHTAIKLAVSNFPTGRMIFLIFRTRGLLIDNTNRPIGD
nr:hypothetical protein [Candidatus Ichthyocystis hellenicum]